MFEDTFLVYLELVKLMATVLVMEGVVMLAATDSLDGLRTSLEVTAQPTDIDQS